MRDGRIDRQTAVQVLGQLTRSDPPEADGRFALGADRPSANPAASVPGGSGAERDRIEP